MRRPPTAESRDADGSSDSEGNFSLSGIAPGSYKLFAWQETVWIGARRNPAFIASYEEHGRPVTVAGASTVTAELTAIPAGK